MRKFLWLSVAAAAVLAAGALFMIFSNDNNQVEKAVSDYQSVVEEQKKEGAPITGNGSMNSLLEMAADLECTISYQSNSEVDAVTEGTYFTSSNRMRGDFMVKVNGNDALSSMILSDNEMYSWTEIEGEKYGMKISLDELKASKESPDMPEANEPVSLDADVKYSCKPWVNVDGSIFVPPTDVIFKDYKDLMNVGMEYGTTFEGGEVNQCALCDKVTGEGKAECKAAFSCE